MSSIVSLKRHIPQPPSLQWGPEASITFRHPGYNSPFDVLFQLPRLDCSDNLTSTSTSTSAAADQLDPRAVPDQRSSDGASAQPPGITGLHHYTALLACQIIANNAFDGFLAADRDGQERVTIGQDEILTADTYWFFANRRHESLNLVENRDVYPILPSFVDWTFPHERFRALCWGPRPHAQVSEATAAPEGTANSQADQDLRPLPTSIPLGPPPVPHQKSTRCVVSNVSYCLQKAHIVPVAQRKWFLDNGMAMYGPGPKLMNNEANMLLMRPDLHALWDNHVFALVPKRDNFAIHVLIIDGDNIAEFAASWHNIPVQKGALQQSKAHTFAKFAQAVFALLKPFIVQPTVHRYVARVQVSPNSPLHNQEVREEWLSGNSLCNFYGGGGGSRSPSTSRKRSRSQASADLGSGEVDVATWEKRRRYWLHTGDADPDCEHGNVFDSDSNAEAIWYEENVAGAQISGSDSEVDCEEPERGRPRKRRAHQQRHRSEHTMDTLPSLTDTSAIGVDDADRSFEETLMVPTSKDGKCNSGSRQTEVVQDQESTST